MAYGLYYAKVLLGSPPKEFLVQTDTGSDGLWVSCESCSGCSQTNNYYDESVSSISYLISCSDKLCSRAATTCTSDRQAQRSYTLHHSSGTNVLGYYVSDVIRLNLNGTLEAPPNVFFGIKYDINLESVSVNGQTFPINQSILRQGRTKVDSGTTLAYLAKGAFLHLFDVITKAARDFVQPTIRDGFQCYHSNYRSSSLLKLMYHAPVTGGYHQNVWVKVGVTITRFKVSRFTSQDYLGNKVLGVSVLSFKGDKVLQEVSTSSFRFLGIQVLVVLGRQVRFSFVLGFKKSDYLEYKVYQGCRLEVERSKL
ncbi:aspartic proteinase-like protein 2 [Artemisia annua]|uniref:Aspartic proteinase-like protein 2 n=1 Tax=Artemisia annua TaxID=35608 RepID=A0A2U1KJG7_ARTAN|nr:aspartic proteinase-like protein 2 [Artemisia annua]